jgi:hypothetical protein
MCKKLCLFLFVLVLVLSGVTKAELIGWWTFDEGSGDTVYDLSGKGNDGHFGPEGDPQWAEGVIGGAIELDGNGDYIEINSLADDLTDNNFTVSAWIKTTAGEGNVIGANDSGSGHQFIFGVTGSGTLLVEAGSTVNSYPPVINDGEWHFIAYVRDGTTAYAYTDGELVGTEVPDEDPSSQVRWSIGQEWDSGGPSDEFTGLIDDVHFFSHPLTAAEIQHLIRIPYASRPQPADGTVLYATWASLAWRPGDFSVSHDVYLGENFDDVNNGTSDTFQGNQDVEFLTIGFPGFAYPDGLVPGTTYYWRIDEVNEADPNSPWRGKVWSLMIPPKTAYEPVPADSAEFVDLNVRLNWTAGFGAKLHYVVFGDDFDDVNNTAMGVPNGPTSYSPGQLELAKTYYWRVDEFDGATIQKGQVWSLITEGAVSGPNPVDGAVDVKPSVVLTWDAGAVAASHEVFFGTEADAVKNATSASPEYKGPKSLGEESYDPGKLMLNTTYYWRIDEVNDSPDSPWAGSLWNFTTGNFFVIDDFEDYDAEENQIWTLWHDGLGYGAPGTQDFFAGNGTGAAVGDETTASYTEEVIVHDGVQSMPFTYDNNKQGFAYYSEVEKKLTNQRDWTEEGVTELSIWFRGYPESVGSFVEEPAGTYTMTATGLDIWNTADEFHYAFKTLTGAGSIVARVESVELSDPWSKAGVMVRETLDAGSGFAAVYITPTNPDGTATNGCRFQARIDTDASAVSDTSVATTEQTAIIAPYWIKLERDFAGNFRGYYSSNGSTWIPMSWNPQNISMSSNVYVGLALTSHNNAATCEAVFSNVTITGTVGPQWVNQDIGIQSNDAEPLYVGVTDGVGTIAIITHNDPVAATINTWTEWVIQLQAFADQGIDLTDVDKIAIGLGTQGNTTVPGGSGKMYIDDIRLYQP